MDLRRAAFAGVVILGASSGCEDFKPLPSFEREPVRLTDEGSPCYGQALAAEGDRIAVSSLTAVFVYRRRQVGAWQLEERIPVREETAGFCIHRPVALSLDLLAFRDGDELRSFAFGPAGLSELETLDMPAVHALALAEERLAVVRETGSGAEDLELFAKSAGGWVSQLSLREPAGETIGNLALSGSNLALHLHGESARVVTVDLEGLEPRIEGDGVVAHVPTVPFEGFAYDGDWLLTASASSESSLVFQRPTAGALVSFTPERGLPCGGQLALEGQLAVASRCGEAGEATLFIEVGDSWLALRTLSGPASGDSWGQVATNGRAVILAKEVTSVGAAGVFIYED